MNEFRTNFSVPTRTDGLRGLQSCRFRPHAQEFSREGSLEFVFFVSRVTITSVLIAQLNDQKPGLLRDFFIKRIRRLLPASLVLIAAVAIWESLFGSVLSSGTRHQEIRSTLLYIANWNFIGQADDYFAEGSVSPLRHMWSLAVEEQFYIFWPFAIFILWKIGARRATTLTVTFSLIAASAVLMYVMYHQNTQGSTTARTPDRNRNRSRPRISSCQDTAEKGQKA